MIKRFLWGVLILASVQLGAVTWLVEDVVPLQVSYVRGCFSFFNVSQDVFDDLCARADVQSMDCDSLEFGLCFEDWQRRLVRLTGRARCLVHFERDSDDSKVLAVYGVGEESVDGLSGLINAYCSVAAEPRAPLPQPFSFGDCMTPLPPDESPVGAWWGDNPYGGYGAFGAEEENFYPRPSDSTGPVFQTMSVESARRCFPRFSSEAAERCVKEINDACGEAVVVHEVQGYRDSMEDAIDFVADGEWLGFAIYDGHNGEKVAQALAGDCAATRLLSLLLAKIQACGAVDDEDVVGIFKEVDARLGKIRGGSTAIVCLINTATHTGYFINLGDSRAVALKKGGAVLIKTVDHTPVCMSACSCEKGSGDACACCSPIPMIGSQAQAAICHADGCEVKRIVNAGGFVNCVGGKNRTNSDLAVARAFGDFTYKARGVGGDTPIGNTPDLYEFDLRDAVKIVIACDGLYECDQVKVSDLHGLIEVATAGSKSPAAELCYEAIARGSGDNISVMVIDVPKLLEACRSVGEKASRVDLVSPAAASGEAGDANSEPRTRRARVGSFG